MWQPNFVPALGFPTVLVVDQQTTSAMKDRECYLGNLYISYIAWDNSGRANN
jgi:hypothetical protein